MTKNSILIFSVLVMSLFFNSAYASMLNSPYDCYIGYSNDREEFLTFFEKFESILKDCPRAIDDINGDERLDFIAEVQSEGPGQYYGIILSGKDFGTLLKNKNGRFFVLKADGNSLNHDSEIQTKVIVDTEENRIIRISVGMKSEHSPVTCKLGIFKVLPDGITIDYERNSSVKQRIAEKVCKNYKKTQLEYSNDEKALRKKLALFDSRPAEDIRIDKSQDYNNDGFNDIEARFYCGDFDGICSDYTQIFISADKNRFIYSDNYYFNRHTSAGSANYDIFNSRLNAHIKASYRRYDNECTLEAMVFDTHSNSFVYKDGKEILLDSEVEQYCDEIKNSLGPQG